MVGEDSLSVLKKFSELDEIVERYASLKDYKDRNVIEVKIAEFLASLGLIEEKPGGYKLTNLGKKFFELTVE